VIDDALLGRLVERVEKVVAEQTVLPAAQVDLIRISIDEVRERISNP
jgi:hypothetical protein